MRRHGRDAADRGQPVLGHRADEAALQRAGAGRRVGRRPQDARSSPRRTLIHDEDVASCKALGAFGATLVPGEATHPDALQRRGAGDGRLRHRARRDPRRASTPARPSRCSPTRRGPFLQGARLTAWELVKDDIDTTVITDNMAGALMRQGLIDLVVVGADRIAANGDTANKIGTYSVAVLAKENGVPFYVAAPLSTIDLATPDGDAHPDRGAAGARGHARRAVAGHAGRRRDPQSRLRRHAGALHHGDRDGEGHRAARLHDQPAAAVQRSGRRRAPSAPSA